MKKVAIMQPYFFPYLGYFSLIKHTDEFILFDTVQFIRHGWIERNRLLKERGGWLYIKVPLIKHNRDALIKDVLIDNSQNWQGTILAQLQAYRKSAPYYRKVRELLEDVLSRKYEDVVSLDKATLEAVCIYLGIDTPMPLFSKMGLDIEEATAPDEWALNICRALGDVSEYWNPLGGQEFFDRSKYTKAGIELKFQKVHLREYNQQRTPFESGLSVLDVMMFNDPKEINNMLDDFSLL